MLERIKDVLKNRKAEGDGGFSLVELAVVIVIIGILVAIAIPVFSGIQAEARQSSVDAAAANGAAVAASNIAAGNAIDAGIETTQGDITVAVTGTDFDDYCVTAEHSSGEEAEKGACP